MKFSEAVDLVRHGTFPVTNKERMHLYVYYKIATVGPNPNCTAPLNPLKRPAWNMWRQNELTQSEAKRRYVELVLSVVR